MTRRAYFLGFLLLGSTLVAEGFDYNPTLEIEKFGQVYMIVSQAYVEEMDDKELFNNAIRGMLTGLDPHSDYLTGEEVQSLQTTSQGKYGGLGIEVFTNKGILKVTTAFDNSPAQKAGIKSGDYIIAIDDKLTKDMSVSQSIQLMRGDPGSSVRLMVLRQNENEPVEFHVVREVIEIDGVETASYMGNIGYIKLPVFNENTAYDIVGSIQAFKENMDLSGLIVDLRNNPGGILSSVVKSTDLFLDADLLGDNKLIVYTKGRMDQSQSQHHATQGDLIKGLPMVVIINEGSASAAEIFAAALQSHNRAVVIGNKSFGKGSVQTVLPLPDSSLIKITTALYYTPDDVSIQAEGVVPDILIPYKTLPDFEEEESWLDSISEENLPDHLVNKYLPQNDEIDNEKERQRVERNSLAKDDFQLYQAMVLLQAIDLSMKDGG